MNSPRPKQVAEINLEEFERRLRASVASQAGIEDPLAELTRLVDTIGLERTPSERALDYGRATRPAPVAELRAPPPPPPAQPVLEVAPPPPPPPVTLTPPPAAAAPPPPALPLLPVEEEEPYLEDYEPPAAASPRPLRDVEPLLRPALDAEDFEAMVFEPASPAAPGYEAVALPPRVDAERPASPARARNWGLKVGGLLAAAAVMAGAVVVFKVGSHAHSGPPPLILASTAPTKVAPPSDDTVRTENESGSLLTRDTAQTGKTPPKLVDTPEAPVDLSARASAAGGTASTGADASPVAPASNTPVVATATPTATPMSPVGSDPNRVKTISVRPDGTLISSSYQSSDAATAPSPPPASSPAPVKPEAAQLADADSQAATPPVALPTKLRNPKDATRVVGKTDTTAPPDEGAGPVPTTPKPKKTKAKPAPVAEADAKSDDAQAPAAASGGYAVQLAAPRSEDEANKLIRGLQAKYADALSSASIGVRKADRHGETIYRVRAGGLSKADAAAMCGKIKAAGGDCFVAKN